MAELQVTGVDLDGLLTLLGSHLYTTPDVAIRELVQNAHDSIVRRRLGDPTFTTGRIRLRGDPARRTLSVSDDGTGMTDAEIKQSLATIGAGATREVRESTANDDLIGMFGVGFLSAFVIGSHVTVETTPWAEPSTGWAYQSSGGRQYVLRPVPPRPPGTTVTIELTDEAETLSDPTVLDHLARRFCSLLRVDVYVGDQTEPINLVPPWRDEVANGVAEHPVSAARRRREFATAFEHLEPLCTIDIVSSDACDVRGLLWVQGTTRYGALDNRKLSVFLRGMLLSDEARELLPRWAGFVGGVVESPNLNPTASREDLQRDEHWLALRAAIERQLIDGLARLSRDEPATWRRILARHNGMLLGAAISEPSLFDLLADTLTVPTSEGDLRVAEIVQRSRGRIHVGVGEAGGFEETVFRAMKVPIATGARYAVLPFLRRCGSERRVELLELGTARGDRQVFRAAALDPPDLQWLDEALADPGDQIVPAHFAPSSLPLVCVPDREVELKKQLESDDADARISRSALSLARAYTARIDGNARRRVFVNLDSTVISRLLERPHGERQ